MKYLYLISFLFLVTEQAFTQSVSAYKDMEIRAGYGLSIAGRGDIPGHQLMLGIQRPLQKHSLIDVRVTGTLMERTLHYTSNYKSVNKSNGIALEADYSYAFSYGRFRFYPSIGPALRFSHEVFTQTTGIYYPLTSTGSVKVDGSSPQESYPLKIGGTGGLNLDMGFSKFVTLGLRTSVQVYRGNTIAFVGLTIKNKRWHF